MASNEDLLWVVRIAIQQREWLLKMKWEGEYGQQYDRETRDNMRQEYRNDLVKLREIRDGLKASNSSASR